MVAQTCGKFPMTHHFGRRVVNIVIDVDVQLIAFEVAVHPSVAPSMQGRIVQGQVQEQLCNKHAQRQQGYYKHIIEQVVNQRPDGARERS